MLFLTSIPFKLDRSIATLKNKWKTIKSNARRRQNISKKAQSKTGGASLTAAEKRILESTLFSDVVTRLGISATGNEPRFDSDAGPSSSSIVAAPTKRLRTVFSRADYVDLDDATNMSFGSEGAIEVPSENVPVTTLNQSSQSNRPGASSAGNRGELEASNSNTSTEHSSQSYSSSKRSFRDIQMENPMRLNDQMMKNNETIALQQRYLQLKVVS